MSFLVVFCAVIAAVNSVKLPSNFKTCNRKQENFNECLLEAAKYGIKQLDRPYKELKMLSLNPLEIPKILASVDTPLVNVSSVLTDCKFYGLIDAKIEKFVIDFDKRTLNLAATWPALKSTCKFTIDGHILRSVVKGEGSSSAAFNNFHWTFNMTYEEVKRRDKTYVKPITTSFDGKPETLSMNLEDLFNGDKEVGERVNKIVNDNWSELYDDVKFLYLDNAKQTWLQIMNGWFSKLSLEEAFDN